MSKPRRVYSEQSPAVQRVADILEESWNKLRGALLNNSSYRAKESHRRAFEKAAITVLTMDLDPELFVQAQLRTPAGAARCKPNFLTGPQAMDRYRKFLDTQRTADVGVYISQLNLIKRLREIGLSWGEIEQGSYSIGPLVLWAMLSMHGLEERAQLYLRSARAEFAKHPELVDIFGPDILRLKS